MQRIVFENRNDEPFRLFCDGCIGTIRTIDAGGDKRVLEVKSLGNIYKDNWGTGFSGNVWDKQMLSPTLSTMQGGGRQPMIIEDFKMEGNNFNQRNIVHGQDSICRTIIGQGHCGNEPKVIVAMRGRNPNNPSDRTVGCPTEQRLEPNSQGMCNTITSVQKDNLVMEVKQVGFMDNGTGKHQSNTVYDENHISPSITTIQGGGTQQIKVMTEPKLIGGIGDKWGDKQYRQGNRVYDSESIAMALTSQPLGNNGGNSYMYLTRETQYRIRKLTPKECWRLMDFTDDDFEKAAEVNSNTQLYKQAGNSIVVNVLVAILGQLLQGKENVYKELSE